MSTDIGAGDLVADNIITEHYSYFSGRRLKLW